MVFPSVLTKVTIIHEQPREGQDRHSTVKNFWIQKMQKNDSLSVDENVEIKGQKIIFNSSLTNQLCFTPLFGFEMVRCACWFSYWWYSFLWEASRCPGCSWRPWDKFFRTNKIKDMWIIYAIFYKNNYNCHWRAFCT